LSRQRWFADLVLVAASLGSAVAGLLAFRTAQTYHVGLLRQVLFVGGPMFLGIMFLACLRLPLDFRVTLAMILLSFVAAAYGAEAYLRELPRLRVRWAARRFGIPYDARSQIEVVRDLRARGKDAWPAAFPAWEGLPAELEGLLPLGGISAVTTVFCNEMGQYVVYFSDEHGFHNPQGIWSSPRLDLAVLGDSFVQGACVPSAENFVALLRAEHPATLNLGMVGNGPLLELAGLREFLVDLKPGTVLWVFTEGNDLPFDLDREKKFPLLTAYLQPGHRQGLPERQAEIDRLLRGLIDREYIARRRGTIEPEMPSRFLELWSLRQALGLYVGDPGLNGTLADLPLFHRILQEAQAATQSRGGRFTFVYLPAEARYFDAAYRRRYDRVREQVLGVLRDLRIPLIDLHPPIVRHPDIAELYAQRGKHFSPAGNRLVAETILEALRLPEAHHQDQNSTRK
jgi:hypothetical protein